MTENEKLVWKVKHKSSFAYENDFLETILIDNGVPEDQIEGFLHPTSKYVIDPFLMKNMKEAVALVHKHVEHNSNIFVKVDPDCDGYCSAAIIIQFLKELNPSLHIDYATSYEKRHGLTYQDVEGFTSSQYQLFIVPDASLTTKDALNIARNFSGDVLVLDHHLIEDGEDNYTDYCLAVNCTDGQYPNPDLSGAGVVQKFIEAYVQTYNEDTALTDKYLDLVSLAINADSMDLRSLESRYYVIQGMKESYWNNEFLNELVERNKEDMKYGRYIISMGWQIAPKINGVIRYGTPEEQIDTFRAMIGIKDDREYQPRRKHKDDPLPPKEIHSLQKTMARVCENVKQRQDNEVRRFVNELEKQIQENHLDKNSVIFVDGTKVLTKGTVTGLCSNKLSSKYFRPVVLMRSKDSTFYGGSMRGYANSPIENTKEFLEKAGVTCAGHAEAAGVQFPKTELQNIINKCNEMMPVDQLCTIHQVDWEIPGNQLKKEYVQEVAENYSVFGSTVPEPLFAITGLEITADKIMAYGENANFIRFVYAGIPFIKKYCKHDDFDNMTHRTRYMVGVNNTPLRMNIIGQFILNTFDDKVIPEIKIIAFDSEAIGSPTPVKVQKAKPQKSETEEFDW